ALDPTEPPPLPLADALPIYGVHVLLMLAGAEAVANHLGDILDFRARIDQKDAFTRLFDFGLVIVVLILDIADNHLDDVFQRYERSEEHTSELQSREKLVCRL